MVGHRHISGAQRTWRADCCHCWLHTFCWLLTCNRHGHSPVLHAIVLMRLLMFSSNDTKANSALLSLAQHLNKHSMRQCDDPSPASPERTLFCGLHGVWQPYALKPTATRQPAEAAKQRFLANTIIAARTSAPLLSCRPLLAGQQGLLQLILGGGSTCLCHLMQALRLLAPGVETPHDQLPGDGRQQRCQQDGQGPRGRQLQQPVGVQSAHGGPMAVMDGSCGNQLVAAATAQSD